MTRQKIIGFNVIDTVKCARIAYFPRLDSFVSCKSRAEFYVNCLCNTFGCPHSRFKIVEEIELPF